MDRIRLFVVVSFIRHSAFQSRYHVYIETFFHRITLCAHRHYGTLFDTRQTNFQFSIPDVESHHHRCRSDAFYEHRHSFVAFSADGDPAGIVTRFPDIIHTLEHLRVPSILTTIIAFLYRYLFVLADEVFRLLRARESRSAGAAGTRSGGSVAWRAEVAGNMAGQLFLRSYERSDRVYNAMLARGYTGHLHTMNPHELHHMDYITTDAGAHPYSIAYR